MEDDGTPKDLASCQAALPQVLADLQQSSTNVTKIAEYCRATYASSPDALATYANTQNYIKDSLSNVSYHIHTMGIHLTNFLQLQSFEMDKLDLQVQALTEVSHSFQ